MPHTTTRGDRAVRWIEQYCDISEGPNRGQPVRLSPRLRDIDRRIYDNPEAPHGDPVAGHLAGYLALLHIAGPEALQQDFRPELNTNIWTVWNATGPSLRSVLKREGARIVCAELGTRWPTAA